MRAAVLAGGLGVTLLATGALGGCARTVAPTGGTVPDLPPGLVSTNPDTFAVVRPFGGPVRFEFERTLSERLTTGSLRDAVVVSPRTGEVTVRQRGSRIEVSMEGGFRSSAVYRITLLPHFQDRFRNTFDRPVELFFSTGPAFDETLVAGLVTDLLTGAEVRGARVDAVPVDDGPTYSTVADSTGVFAFRFLPAGAYRIVAFDDVNRNRTPDFPERQAATQVTVGPADTLIVSEMELLQPDTTAAVLAAVALVDSVAVALDFDDPLDPDHRLGEVRVTLHPLPADSLREGERAVEAAELPAIVEVIHGHIHEARRAQGDPPAPDPAGGDPPADPAAAGEPEAGGAPQDPEERIRPGRRLVAILEGPLPPGVRLIVRVEGVENLAGIPGGGGEGTLATPEPPEEAPADPPDDPPDTPPGPTDREARGSGLPVGSSGSRPY